MSNLDIESSVDLGFAEKSEDEEFLKKGSYVSKLGGKPFWISTTKIPRGTDVQCGNCFRQMTFLCQLYVPGDNELVNIDNNTYEEELLINKMFYLFCCNNGKCYSSKFCVKALRFPCKDDGSSVISHLNDTKGLCNVCGCFGDKKCSSCNQVSYCCKEHQVIDWKFLHKRNCGQQNLNQNKQTYQTKVQKVSERQRNPFLFDEYEIVIETEPSKEERLKIIQEKYKKYENYMTENKDTPLDSQLENDLKRMSQTKGDKMFFNFKERIECEPEQIVRYDLNGEPLWVSSENIPTENDIPLCKCGSKRHFEFQILPQMLNYLGVETTEESIDWGTLIVYTCQKNCANDAYMEEFVWKQDFSNQDVLKRE